MAFEVPDTITMQNAPAALAAGESALEAGERVFDFSGLEKADSSALAVCLAWMRGAQKRNLIIDFTHLPPALEQLAGVYGVTELLHRHRRSS
jgi:phospholipid transport system transporter-binding protein